MSAALRIVELDRNEASTLTPASMEQAISTRKAAVPHSAETASAPSSKSQDALPDERGWAFSEAPSTQRCATVQTSAPKALSRDARNLLTVARLNVEFLAAQLHGQLPKSALEALEDLHESIERLERKYT